MKLYKIRNWNEIFENNRSRVIENLHWVPIPNRHDGENFSEIMTHKDGAMIYSAFILMIQIASKCHPRGTLIKDNGTPHNGTSMSVKCRAPALWFETALSYLEASTDWLDVEHVTTERQVTDVQVPDERQADVTEGRKEGIEGTEQNEGKKEEEPKIPNLSYSKKGEFRIPSLIEVKHEFMMLELPESEAVAFFDNYEANGWRMGMVPMNNLQAACRKWKTNSQKFKNNKPVKAAPVLRKFENL